MRIATGYWMIIIFFAIFVFSLHGMIKESKHTNSFTQTLDQKIPIKNIELQQNSYLVDRNNTVISEITGPEQRIFLDDNHIPAMAKNIFISVEDQQFYTHMGFSIPGIARAAMTNMQNNEIEQGGSTITQQLARNLYLTNEKSYNRKLSELLYSYQLERKLSKQKILELYINEIYFQHGVYGIEAASKYYFNQPSTHLSLAQLAFLCAIPNNPSLFDPINHFGNTKKRQTWILKKLMEQKFINQSQYKHAIDEIITLHIDKEINDLYPDYVTYIQYELKNLIAEKEGYTARIENAPENKKEEYRRQLTKRYQQILHSGIIIHTALNQKIQATAKKATTKYLPYSDVQGAVVVTQNNTHQIVAITGGKNYKKGSFQRGFQAYRQPGSAIKPLLVYGPYINEKNANSQTTVSGAAYCHNGYCPQNYGGHVYGNVTLETALKYSYNTSAVRLLEQVGIEKAFQYLRLFQFKKVNQTDYSLPAALGGFSYGMTPLELTNAYTTFANNGKFMPSHGIIDVSDTKGNVLYKWNDKETTVWSIQTNTIMRGLLSKVVTEGTARRAYFPSNYIGGKTGTTNDYKDLWFIGLTSEYTAGVWVGRDRPESIEAIDRVTPQLSIWKMVMSE